MHQYEIMAKLCAYYTLIYNSNLILSGAMDGSHCVVDTDNKVCNI